MDTPSLGDIYAALQAGDTSVLAHHGVKGQRWGVKRDERALSTADKALNISQRTQVRVASSISALSALGMTTNAAATLFQLQSRWEHLKIVNAVLQEAQDNPLVGEAGREGLRRAKSNIVKGIVASAVATTAASIAIGIIAKRTATAYFAPMHKVYGDVKPKINADLKKLSKDIKAGKRPKLTVSDYNKEVAAIVQKHMTEDKSNLLKPFHELARSQLGLQYNTKDLDIKFTPLPNTDIMSKMTVTTPDGLVLVKAIKVVEHADSSETPGGLDFYFDYKFDSEGFISEFSCPTIEVAKELTDGTFDLASVYSRFDPTASEEVTHMDDATLGEMYAALKNGDHVLIHHGIKGQRWGIRRKEGSDGNVSSVVKAPDSDGEGHSSVSVLGREAKKAPPGSVAAVAGADGSLKTVIKKSDGSWEEIHLSADSERSVQTLQKQSSEMSTREMKEAVARAKQIKEYNDTFLTPDANKALREKVDALNLQKQYSQLNAELNPSRVAQIAKLVKNYGPGFETFKALDDASGNALTNSFRVAMGMPKKPVDTDSILKREIESMKLDKEHRDLSAQLGVGSGAYKGKHTAPPPKTKSTP